MRVHGWPGHQDLRWKLPTPMQKQSKSLRFDKITTGASLVSFDGAVCILGLHCFAVCCSVYVVLLAFTFSLLCLLLLCLALLHFLCLLLRFAFVWLGFVALLLGFCIWFSLLWRSLLGFSLLRFALHCSASLRSQASPRNSFASREHRGIWASCHWWGNLLLQATSTG